MIKRKIRPAEEETGGLSFTILFAILWYGTIGISIAGNGFQTEMLLFMAAGLLPLYQMFTKIRRALFYRRQRADAVALGDAAHGRIVGVTRQDIPYYTSGRHSHLSYRRYYYLNVEMTDPRTGITTSIQSQGYRRPIHRYLRSIKVKVYTDKSGWKHYLEDFQWKEHRSDPDLFDCPREFEEAYPWNGRIGQIIVAAVLVLMILNLFLNL